MELGRLLAGWTQFYRACTHEGGLTETVAAPNKTQARRDLKIDDVPRKILGFENKCCSGVLGSVVSLEAVVGPPAVLVVSHTLTGRPAAVG
ncbi:hypothetical protein AVEN_32829-1 [Araneus ventricosus]|uniref:Uncharacterized protein n=1 Tax=Araneus ventricosus TaxID=182803 RepID=A0A4Y2DY76_ARAVE|nr:hypothetical protein AVEN_32829-1 [Araneus ventricosus]